MSATLIRTFETFDIRWERGSTWTNFTEAEAAERIAFSVARGGDGGEVIRRTFDVRIPASMAARPPATPCIAERWES